MRLLYIVTKSEIGGVQTHISQLSHYMYDLKNEVAVMSQPDGILQKNVQSCAKYYPNKYFSNSLNPFVDLLMANQINLAIKHFKPDIISCHSSVAGFLTRIVVKNRIPVVFTAHGWAFTDGSPKWRKILAILAEKYAAKYCKKIICVSEKDRQLAIKYKIAPIEKLMTIHNGTEIETWEKILQLKADQKKAIFLTRYGEQIRIIFVGRLAIPKDPITLVEAFKQLPENLQQASSIFIVGDGPNKEELENLIQKLNLKQKIYLLGGIDRQEVRKIYLFGDIYVLTSNWEGLSRSVIEAMSCGLPVIASDVGGNAEAVDESCGFLVQRGDVERVKDALEKLITDKKLREKMGKAGYEKAAREFSLDRMLEETEKVYVEVTKSKI